MDYPFAFRLVHDVDAHPYKIQILHLLKLHEHAEQPFGLNTVCALLLNDIYVDNVWFSDECYILLSGNLNKQNMRFFDWQKPD